MEIGDKAEVVSGMFEGHHGRITRVSWASGQTTVDIGPVKDIPLGFVEVEEAVECPLKTRDVPPGEDFKWVCGDCGATDWTSNGNRCESCME